MTANTIEERKRYINEIKASFHDPGQSGRYGDISTGAATAETVGSFWKVQLLTAVLIFATFVYCDQNQIKIGGYTTRDAYERIEETISIEKVLQTMESMVEYKMNDE